VTEEEEWRAVVGYEGLYEVSSLGRVRSLDRVIERRSGPARYKGRVLSQGLDQAGYPLIVLSRCGVQITQKVHTLVCTAFHGARPNGKEAAHGDGKPGNAGAGNLRWATPVENNADKRLHGTHREGEAHAAHILSEDQVREIRHANGPTHQELADQYGISQSQISQIRSGKAWKCLEMPADPVSGPRRKLNDSAVREMRLSSGVTLAMLGKKYGVSEALVCLVRQRKIYRHID
jgi:DNA-binding XRE family transcriptional regulator